jgi:hypothetical protein
MREEKPRNPMVTVIEQGLVGIHASEDALSRLWRILLYETKIRGSDWHTRLNKWQQKMQRKYSDKEAASLKGNITKTLAKNNLSWRTFIRGIQILGYECMDIELTLWKNNKPQKIFLSIKDLSDKEAPEQDEIEN